MPTIYRCPECQTKIAISNAQVDQIITCPSCKLKRKLQGKVARPARQVSLDDPAPGPLSLDDDDQPVRSGLKPAVLAGVVGVILLLCVGGGVGAWLAFGRKSQATAELTASADPAKDSDPAEPPKPLTGEQVYKRLLLSTVFIVTEKGLGSGVVVQSGKRLIVTNHHVVKGHSQAIVFFPAYDDKKQLVTAADHYKENVMQWGIKARVLDSMPVKDLAVLEAERISDYARPIPFASKPAPTGATAFSIGASGIDRNLLWKLSSGIVTGRSNREVKTQSGITSGTILETSAGVNPGDSGGPVVNDRAELVGIVAHFDSLSRDVSGNIDIEEVRYYMESVARKNGWTWESVPPSDFAPLADDSESVKKLIVQLKDSDPAKRLAAANRLATLGPGARPAIPELMTCLDDSDDKVQRAATQTLDNIGSFTKTDLGTLDLALGSGLPKARLFALKYYASNPATKIPESHFPIVLQTLKDTSAENRKLAMKIIGNSGTGCKPKTLAAILERIGDEDPTIAADAGRVLATYSPFNESDQAALVGGLKSKQASVRLVVATILAEPAGKVPENMLPTVVQTLSDPSIETRRAALRILRNYGPGCKSKALEAVLERIADDDPTVAAEANTTFTSFAPFDEKERPILIQCLTNTKAAARLIAATILTVEAPDAASAVAWFRPRLADTDARVRMKAIEALVKWGAKSKDCLPDLLGRFEDDTLAVAIAAVRAAVVMDNGPTVIAALGRVLGSNDAKAELKAAATNAILSLELADADAAVPVLAQLLGSEKANIRLTALTKLAKFGDKGKPALAAIASRVKDDDAGVKVMALKALAPFGADAADSIPTIAGLLDGKQPDAVANTAAEPLPKLGPKAIDSLIKALDAKLPKDALIAVCEGLGEFGKDAQAAGQALLNAALKQPSLRTLMDSAWSAVNQQKPWAADPAAAAVGKIGGDKAAKQLVEWASYELKVINGVRKPVAIKGDGIMLWSILVLGSLDPDSLTPKVRDQVAAELDILASYAPTATCKSSAKSAKAKFPLKK